MKNEILDEGFRTSNVGDGSEIYNLKNENEEYEMSIGYGRYILFILSGFVVLSSTSEFNKLFSIKRLFPEINLVEFGCLFLVYFGAAICSYKDPIYSFIIALIFYLVYESIVIYFHFETLGTGYFDEGFIIAKTMVIVLLIMAIQGGMVLKKNNNRISNLEGS